MWFIARWKTRAVRSSNPIQVEQLQPDEVDFTIPAGIAPGPAAVRVGTSKGPAFSGFFYVRRVVAVRDDSGQISLVGLGEGATATRLKPVATLGDGAGAVAIGDSGRVLAASSRKGRQLVLALVSPEPVVSAAAGFDSDVRDLAVSQEGHVAVATDSGIYWIARPAPLTAETKLTPAATSWTKPALAVVFDRHGARGAALVRDGSKYYLENLTISEGNLKIDSGVALSWTVDSQATLDVAIGSDGSTVAAISSKQPKLVWRRFEETKVAEVDLPKDQSGPISISAGTAPGVFYVVNSSSRVTVATLSSGTAELGALDPGTKGENGSLLSISASDNDELVLLCQRDLFLIQEKGTKSQRVAVEELFVDGNGVAAAIQP